ncbi:hypothetical protein BX666DRAFT_842611 [Dichotomocladium elegans]|nr:hypothetical protein BX666DRAFT_842611 [Dichotomocladium elegans]
MYGQHSQDQDENQIAYAPFLLNPTAIHHHHAGAHGLEIKYMDMLQQNVGFDLMLPSQVRMHEFCDPTHTSPSHTDGPIRIAFRPTTFPTMRPLRAIQQTTRIRKKTVPQRPMIRSIRKIIPRASTSFHHRSSKPCIRSAEAIAGRTSCILLTNNNTRMRRSPWYPFLLRLLLPSLPLAVIKQWDQKLEEEEGSWFRRICHILHRLLHWLGMVWEPFLRRLFRRPRPRLSPPRHPTRTMGNRDNRSMFEKRACLANNLTSPAMSRDRAPGAYDSTRLTPAWMQSGRSEADPVDQERRSASNNRRRQLLPQPMQQPLLQLQQQLLLPPGTREYNRMYRLLFGFISPPSIHTPPHHQLHTSFIVNLYRHHNRFFFYSLTCTHAHTRSIAA